MLRKATHTRPANRPAHQNNSTLPSIGLAAMVSRKLTSCSCIHTHLQRLADLHDALILFADLDGETEARHKLEHLVIVAQHFPCDH